MLTLGLESSFLERVVIPSTRIPCDDSDAKVMLFPDSANKSCDRFPVKPGMTVTRMPLG